MPSASHLAHHGRDPTWRGLGVDLDEDAIAEARRRAAERLPGRDVRFEVRDAGAVSGRHDAVLNVGSSHVHGGYPAALGALRGLVADGGAVVFGEGYWREPPSDEFLAALGGATEDELDTFGGLRSAALAAGFEIEAGDADWARYEDTLAANAERAGDPDSLAYARRIRERRARCPAAQARSASRCSCCGPPRASAGAPARATARSRRTRRSRAGRPARRDWPPPTARRRAVCA